MEKKQFFSKIDFNKPWDEKDWEKFFQAQDDYRLAVQNTEIRKKPAAKIVFIGPDEVAAFEPVMQAYGVSDNLFPFDDKGKNGFLGDANPDLEYHPPTNEDPHYWGEGAPLATVLIYRDSCRFAICTSQEIDRHLKRRDLIYRRQYTSESEALRFHANWVAINVAQGHRIGYSEERIRGNITKCARAVKHTDTCIALLNKLSTRTRSHRLRHELFSFAVQLRNGLLAWIDELRARHP